MNENGGIPYSGENKTIKLEDFAIFTAVTLVNTGFSAGYLFISLFLIQVKHAFFIDIGLIYLATGAIDIAVQTIGGKLSDRSGTKTVALMGLAGSAAVYILLSLFVYLNSPFTLYLIVFPALGLFSGLFQLAVSSYISDRKTEQMASGMSLLYVGANLGFTAGPFLGGVVVAYSGYVSLFVFGTLTVVASIIVALIGIRNNPVYALRVTDTNRQKTTLTKLNPSILFLLALVSVSWFVIAFQAVPLSVFESKFLSLSSIEIGIVLSSNGLLITLLQSTISRLVRIEKKARLYPVALGSVLMAAGYLVVSFSRTFVLLEFAITLTTLGEMMIAVPTQVVVTLFSEEHNRGQYQGYYFAFSRAGGSLSAFMGFVMFTIFAEKAVFGWYLVAIVSVVAALGYSLLSPIVEKGYGSISTMREVEL